MPVVRTDKLDIADEMLDVAIDSFFKRRYFVAVNLAGVAQELYGKKVRLSGLKDQIQETIEAANALAAQRGGGPIEDRVWKKIAGLEKNSIKHFNSGADQHIDIDAEDEARLRIGEAVSEHDTLKRAHTPNLERFNEWAKEYAANALTRRSS